MAKKCPKKIRFNLNRLVGETDEQHIERVYGIFLPLLMKMCASNYRGKIVRIPDYGEPDFYKSFFYHIIKYNQVTKTFNYQRLVTCCYLPAIILEQCAESCAFVEDNPSKSKKKRNTLFCSIHNFVIVYEERKNSFYICTAYHVSKKDAHKFLNSTKKATLEA